MKDNFLDFIEDVQDRLADFSAIQIIMCVVVVICLIGSVIGIFGMRSSNVEFEAKSQENSAEIMSLNSELSALTSENNRQPNASDIEVALKSANTAGVAVAGLQTSYQDIDINMGLDGDTFEQALTKNAEALDVYFEDSAKNARVPWFSVTGDTKDRLVWTFMTNYTFTTDTVECLWLCRDSSNNLVAFALGTYTASTSMFSDVTYYATAYGNQTYRTPDDPMPVYTRDLYDGSTTTVVNPEDILSPDGYTFDNEGNLIGPDGEPYMGDEDWASNFEDAFKSSKEYREYMLSQGRSD